LNVVDLAWGHCAIRATSHFSGNKADKPFTRSGWGHKCGHSANGLHACTIVGRINRANRTTRKRLARIEIDRFEQASWRSKRIGNALPKRVQAVIETGRELVKEARGLGRARSARTRE
jgi:hypothetical protein